MGHGIQRGPAFIAERHLRDPIKYFVWQMWKSRLGTHKLVDQHKLYSTAFPSHLHLLIYTQVLSGHNQTLGTDHSGRKISHKLALFECLRHWLTAVPPSPTLVSCNLEALGSHATRSPEADTPFPRTAVRVAVLLHLFFPLLWASSLFAR